VNENGEIAPIMQPYRIFISSIMNRAIEDLFVEREAARAAVEHFAPITTAWAFESEPASSKPLLDFYIDAVKPVPGAWIGSVEIENRGPIIGFVGRLLQVVAQAQVERETGRHFETAVTLRLTSSNNSRIRVRCLGLPHFMEGD
jgi:hypothetical protein